MTSGAYTRCGKHGCRKKAKKSSPFCPEHTSMVKFESTDQREKIISEHKHIDAHIRQIVLDMKKEGLI